MRDFVQSPAKVQRSVFYCLFPEQPVTREMRFVYHNSFYVTIVVVAITDLFLKGCKLPS